MCDDNFVFISQSWEVGVTVLKERFTFSLTGPQNAFSSNYKFCAATSYLKWTPKPDFLSVLSLSLNIANCFKVSLTTIWKFSKFERYNYSFFSPRKESSPSLPYLHLENCCLDIHDDATRTLSWSHQFSNTFSYPIPFCSKFLNYFEFD